MKSTRENQNRSGFSPWRMLVPCLLAWTVAVGAAPGVKAQADILDLDNTTFGWTFGLDSWQITFDAINSTTGDFEVAFDQTVITTVYGFDVSSTACSGTFVNANSDELYIYIGTSGGNSVTAPTTSEFALVFLMEGNDVYSGMSTGGRNEVYGGGGNDQITTYGGMDVIYGDDWFGLTGSPGDDSIHAGDDDDYIDGGPGVDDIYGGMGADTLSGGTGTDDIYGDTGGITTGDSDVIYGGDDDDYLRGDGGADTIYGGSGDDAIDGGSGADTMYGEAGVDFIHDNDGTGGDTLNGGDDRDELFSDDAAADTLVGGAGTDYSMEAGTETSSTGIEFSDYATKP